MKKLFDKTKSIFGLDTKEIDVKVINGVLQKKDPENNDKKPELKSLVHKKEVHKEPEPETATEKHNIATKKGRLPKIDRFWNFLIAHGRAKRIIQEYKYEFTWWTKKASW